jgi:transposase
MRAFDRDVLDVIWELIEPLLPVPADTHPLGCHRPRSSDRDCFQLMLVRLVTGCSWEDAEFLCDGIVSDTTARARRDEWIAAGVYDAVVEAALARYEREIALDLTEVALDGSLHKAPCGGEGTGKNPTDRAKLGWKWSVLTDRNGIPIGWAIDGANRHDSVLLEPTLDDAARRGLLTRIERIWLDRGYDSGVTRERLAARQISNAAIAQKRRPGSQEAASPKPMGLRWPVERTNSWLSNYGQIRRNTDRKVIHRLAQFALVVTLLIVAKLIDRQKSTSKALEPIR